MTFPTLYHKGKHGAMFQWVVWTDGSVIHTEYGQVGGAKQVSEKAAEPKNVGRSNATTGPQQADFEARAMFDFKLTRKYSKTPEEAKKTLFLPMLAQSITGREGKFSYPVDVQPKLDGLRMMASWNDEGTKVLLMSRSGKFYNVPHIQAQLEKVLPKDAVTDGEIYCHGMTLQTINSLAKRNQRGSEKLNYYVYDMPCWGGEEDQPWSMRRLNLVRFFESGDLARTAPSIAEVATFPANDLERVLELQQAFVSDGFEGAIVRVLNGLYLYGYRSYDLLKVKSFQDGEFKVVGAKPGRGKFADMCIFTCKMDTGLEFDVVPKGTAEQRQEYLSNKEKYIGKLLTVRYFNLTPDGKPFLPVGVTFRLKEDMPKRKK